MKINEAEAESIFAYAEALEKSGRMKNSVFCSEKTVYIINYDKTVLLRFQLSKDITQKLDSIAFFGSDYESSKFQILGGLIGFESSTGEWTRTTTCRIPNQTFQDIEILYKKLYNSTKGQIVGSAIIDRGVTDLIKENLSHIELVVRQGELHLIQRDIYSGSVSEIKRRNKEGLGLIEEPYEFKSDPSPLGIRTDDFLALFSFTDKIILRFLPLEFGYFLVEADHANLHGIIGGCLFDLIGSLNYILPPTTIESAKSRLKRRYMQEVKKSGRKIP